MSPASLNTTPSPNVIGVHYRTARADGKTRRNEDPKIRSCSFASAATRCARQAVRESQIQTARAQVLLISVISDCLLAGRRPARRTPKLRCPAGAVAPAGLVALRFSLRIFGSST